MDEGNCRMDLGGSRWRMLSRCRIKGDWRSGVRWRLHTKDRGYKAGNNRDLWVFKGEVWGDLKGHDMECNSRFSAWKLVWGVRRIPQCISSAFYNWDTNQIDL